MSAPSSLTPIPVWQCFLHVPILALLSSLAPFTESSYLREFFWVTCVLMGLYFGITGALWAFYYSPLSAWGGGPLPEVGRKIQPRRAYGWAQASDEIVWSVLTIVTGGSLVAIVTWLYRNNATTLYWTVGDYGLGWLAASLLAMLVFNDMWMFACHRFLHQRWGYARVHKIHHRFVAPSPFSTMAMHPVEGAMLFGPVVGAIAFPMYVPMLLAVSFVFFMVSITEHIGWTVPVYDKLDHYVSTPIHHDLHHSLVRCNYGVYLTLWDHVFGSYVSESDRTGAADAKRQQAAIET